MPAHFRDGPVDTSGGPRSGPLPGRALVDPIELQLVLWADKDEVGEAPQHPVAVVGIAWASVAPQRCPFSWNGGVGEPRRSLGNPARHLEGPLEATRVP